MLTCAAHLSPDSAAEDEYEHNVRPLDVQEPRSLGAATEHASVTVHRYVLRILIEQIL